MTGRPAIEKAIETLNRKKENPKKVEPAILGARIWALPYLTSW